MRFHSFDRVLVEELDPSSLTEEQLQRRAESIQGILLGAWGAKFVPGLMSDSDLYSKINPSNPDIVESQVSNIAYPQRAARYLISTNKVAGLQKIELGTEGGVLRVEAYRPRRNPFRKRYPNVTDLEVRGGKISGVYEKHAAAMLWVALMPFDADLKTATYTVMEDENSKNWFTDLGYRATTNRPTEQIGKSVITYQHMEAESLVVVFRELVRQYPFLASEST